MDTRTRGPWLPAATALELTVRCGGGKVGGSMLAGYALCTRLLPILRSCPGPSITTSCRVLMYTPTQNDIIHASKTRMPCFTPIAAMGPLEAGGGDWRLGFVLQGQRVNACK